MKYYVFLREDGTVKSTLATTSSPPDGGQEISAELFNVVNTKKYDDGEWVDKPSVAREITRKELLKLFTQDEKNKIANCSDEKVQGFLLTVADGCDTEDPYFETALNAFENTLNLIGVGRAVQVLAEAQVLAGV